MSDREQLEALRAFDAARQSGDQRATLDAMRNFMAIRERRKAAQPPQVPAEPAVTPQDLGIPMSPESIQPTEAPNAELEAQMQRERIVPGSAPAGIRARAGFGLDELTGYRQAFGPDYQVEEIKTPGPLRGEIVFRKKDEENWTSVRGAKQGFNLGDIASMLGEVPPTVGGIAGGIAGTMASPAAPGVANVLGTGAGAFAGELARLAAGKSMGLIPPDAKGEDILLAASKRAGIDMLGAGAGVAAYNLYRNFVARGLPELGIDADEFVRRLRETRASVPEEARGLITPGSVIGETPGGAPIAAAEARLARQTDPAGTRMREITQGRERFGYEALQRELPPEPNLPTVTEIGRNVSEAIPTGEAGYRRVLPGARTSPDEPMLGQRVKGAIERAYEATKAPIQKAFENTVDSAMASGPLRSPAYITPLKTHDTVVRLNTNMADDLFPGLAKDARSLVDDWLNRAIDPGTQQLKKIDYEQIADGLTRIRDAKRLHYKGEWKGPMETLDIIEEALVKDRNDLLSNVKDINGNNIGPKLLRQVENAEREYRDLQQLFRREAVADLFRVRPGGKDAISATRFTSKMFSDAETARIVGRILSGPRMSLDREAVRGMFRWEADAAALKGGKINADNLETWVGQNEVVLRNFFTPQEINRLRQVPNLERTRKALGLKGDENPTQWFNKFWSTGNAEQAQEIMRRLRRDDPETARAVQGLARQKLFGMFTKPSEQATKGAFDTEALGKMLAEPGRADWVQATLDPGFRARMEKLTEVMQVLTPRYQAISAAKESGEPTSIGVLKRGGRAALGALSTQARVFNSLLTISEDRIRARVAEALLDPDRFAEILRLAKRTPQGVATSAAIGQVLLGGSPATEIVTGR